MPAESTESVALTADQARLDNAPGKPHKGKSATPRWVYWSTPDSVKAEMPSAMAIAETSLAVTAFWWLALRYELFRPLLVSAAVMAPLVLLRSPESQTLGVRWFLKLEEKVAGLLRPSNIVCGVYLFDLYDGLGRALFMALIVVFWLWFPHMLPVSPEISTTAYFSLSLGLLTPILLDLYQGWKEGYIKYKLVELSIGMVLIFALFIFGLLNPGTYKFSAMAIGAFFFIATFGMGILVLLAAFLIRLLSTLFYLKQGVAHIPQNFRQLALCTSPLHEPEIVPGLSDYTDKFGLRSLGKRYRTEPHGDWFDLFAGRKLFGYFLLLWFAPAWLYRITLKSTSWLWWPLAILGAPPKLATNPEWFHEQVMETKWAKHTRALAYISILSFFGVSLYRTIEEKSLPDNPFLSVIGYAFSIEWSAASWQVLGLVGSIVTLAVVYLTDWYFSKYSISKDTMNLVLADEALRHLTWIERLSRARTIIFLVYCALVGFHGVLVLNARSCWFDPTPSIQSWAKALYRERTPLRECNDAKRIQEAN